MSAVTLAPEIGSPVEESVTIPQMVPSDVVTLIFFLKTLFSWSTSSVKIASAVIKYPTGLMPVVFQLKERVVESPIGGVTDG